MGREDLTTRAQITFVLDKDIVNFIRTYSKETSIPMSRYIEKLIRDDMQKQEAAKGANN